jgi:hypothetical protein
MRMCELSLSERDMLDKLNEINKKYEKNETQSLWNVCWGYLHNKFNSNILNKTDSEIKKILLLINEQAPKIKVEENLNVSVDEMYTSVGMAPLF